MTTPGWLDQRQPDAAHEAMRVALRRVLDDLQAQIDEINSLKEAASTMLGAVIESETDRKGIRAWVAAVEQHLGTVESAAKQITAHTAAHFAYSAGTAAIPGGLSGTGTVTVTLARPMPDATFAPVATLSGGSALLGSLVIDGVLSWTATTVTVRVRNTALLPLATGATVHVLAVSTNPQEVPAP